MEHSVRLLRVLREIDANLQEAIRCYAVFRPVGQNKPLISRINTAGVNPGANVISEALHKSVLVTLCRIWDKRSDTASVQCLTKELRKEAQGAKGISRRTLAEFEAKADEIRGSNELVAITQIRHRVLAHTANPNEVNRSRVRGAIYGDERNVIQSTITLVKFISDAVHYSPIRPYDEIQKTWERAARDFWRALTRS